MLHVFFGTDREKARSALAATLSRSKSEVLRITDAHAPGDLEAALQGPGMFGAARIVVLDSVLTGSNTEMSERLHASLPSLAESTETFLMIEGALDAATKKELTKVAGKMEQFDAPKRAEEKTIFVLANALQRGDKKALWVGLMREYAKGSAPEAVHGLLFWGAKQMVLKARSDAEAARGRGLATALAALPHESRRKGEDLSYALERFVLSGV
jgi:hypothetical protein